MLHQRVLRSHLDPIWDAIACTHRGWQHGYHDGSHAASSQHGKPTRKPLVSSGRGYQERPLHTFQWLRRSARAPSLALPAPDLPALSDCARLTVRAPLAQNYKDTIEILQSYENPKGINCDIKPGLWGDNYAKTTKDQNAKGQGCCRPLEGRRAQHRDDQMGRLQQVPEGRALRARAGRARRESRLPAAPVRRRHRAVQAGAAAAAAAAAERCATARSTSSMEVVHLGHLKAPSKAAGQMDLLTVLSFFPSIGSVNSKVIHTG